jgi:transglutaminase-like putative cysteine protease
MGNEITETLPSVKENIIDGNSFAREDFSQKANPDIFNDIYTREAYNAIRQTIADRDFITQDTDETGYNPNYSYAHYIDEKFTFNNAGKSDTAIKSAVSVLRGYYEYTFGVEPYVSNFFEYPGYRICKVMVREHYAPANNATESFVQSLENVSDIEKVKRIQEYISDRIVYNGNDVAGLNKVFTSSTPVNGLCGTYSDAFIYLCQRANIPCITVQSSDHAWNEVYVEGHWRTVDVSYYDIARDDNVLLNDNYPKTDINIAGTKFAKELLVPSSTK